MDDIQLQIEVPPLGGNNYSFSCWCNLWGWIINFDTSYTIFILWFEPICFMRYFSLYVDKKEGNLGWLPYLIYQLSSIQGSAKNIKSRVEIKHFSIVGLMSPGWVRTHSDFCWTRGLGLWPTGLGLWSNGLGLGLGLWSNGLGLTPDGLGLWSYGLGLGLGLWPCGLGLTAGLTSPDSLQHWYFVKRKLNLNLITL